MSKKTLISVLDNLPRKADNVHITFTGGEPFIVPKRLREGLGYIQQHKKRLFKGVKNAVICVQSNGFWITSYRRTYDNIKRLIGLGVDELDISGKDKWHAEQGLDLKQIDLEPLTLRRVFKEDIPCGVLAQVIEKNRWYRNAPILIDSYSGVDYTGTSSAVLALGRGKFLPKKEQKASTSCSVQDHFANESYFLAVDIKGNVYPCCEAASPPIGSAVKKPIDEIIAESRKSPLISGFIEDGLRGAAKAFGIRLHERDLENQCNTCERIFKIANQ